MAAVLNKFLLFNERRDSSLGVVGNYAKKKRMKKICYYLFLFTAMGCSDFDYVRFEVAQPAGVKEVDSFNRKTRGLYVNCLEPGDQLLILADAIVHYRTYTFKSHRNDLHIDSIKDDQNNAEALRKVLMSAGYEVKMENDTVTASLIKVDTVFQIAERQRLKRFKSSYYLNYRENERGWLVKRLNLINKDTLLIGQITPSDTLLRFDFVAKKEEYDNQDSTTVAIYSINPTKQQFKQLLKSNSFEACACYRLKK
jgi:hypothetical protein